MLKAIRFLNLGLVGLFVFYIENGQIDIGLSFWQSPNEKISHEESKCFFVSNCQFVCLLVYLSVYSLIPL